MLLKENLNFMSSVLIYALGWMGMRGEGIPQIISILQMADYKNIKFSIFCRNKICIKMNTLSQDKMLIIKKIVLLRRLENYSKRLYT